MAEDPLDYPRLLRDALRSVVRRALRVAAEQGLPGEHHFFVSFLTGHPGVVVPAVVRRQHPGEMTIVLQHQFWNLEVEEDAFSVDLRFGGVMSRVTVPFSALTAFADPSCDLGLRFDSGAEEPADPLPPVPPPPPLAHGGDGKLVDIRAFRRKT